MVERIDREEGVLRAKEEMGRAAEELKAATVLHEKGFYFKAVASAYYSIYHAAKALLLIKGVDPKSQKAWRECSVFTTSRQRNLILPQGRP